MGEGSYLLVVEASSSRSFALPLTGEALIGRDPEADLQLGDTAASRRHASLTMSDGDVVITDLDSRNGTRVNEQPLIGSRKLVSGDVVSIGNATLVLRGRRTLAAGRQVLDAGGLRRRLDEEIERSLVTQDPFAVLLLALAPPFASEGIAHALDPELRLMDAAGWNAAGELVVLLPGRDLHAGREVAERLLLALRLKGQEARAGLTSYPGSGVDADTLIEATRAVAARAPLGEMADPVTTTRIELGERQVVVADPAMVGLFDLIRRLAPSDLPVLVRGETGAGKENAAFALHHWSPRASGPFVAINCAALPETLIESELFGAEKGAFSGASGAKPGLFETANGGTVFLDELGELPRVVQPKLLRVIETRMVARLGSTRERALDVRFVAATNRDLEAEVKAGHFREDLLFRLNAATIVLPPLRDRPTEVAILAQVFLEAACRRLARPVKGLSAAALHVLSGHSWPGNVRELKNVMEFLAATVVEPILEPAHLQGRLVTAPVVGAVNVSAAVSAAPPPHAVATPAGGVPAGARLFAPIADEIRTLEQTRMREALELSDWVQTRAAEIIGMPLRTFQQKYKQYGLSRPKPG
jgi:DNA-binding NtrC family response regulator